MGPALEWARSYSTFARHDPGLMGTGWRSNLEMFLTPGDGYAGSLASAPSVVVVQENGSRVKFTKGSDGRYGSLARVRATLEAAPGGGFVFNRRDGQVFVVLSIDPVPDLM